jgi:hypothetical protein
MNKTVLLQYGTRQIAVSFTETSTCLGYDAMYMKFVEFASKDHQFKLKTDKIPIFNSYSKLFKKNVELNPGSSIEDGDELYLSFINPLESPLKRDELKVMEVCYIS